MRAAHGPLPLVQRVDHLLARAEGRRVLHLGCTNAPYTADSLRDGSLLHLQFQHVAADLHGVDIDRAGLDLLAGQGLTNLHCGTIAQVADALSATPFDLIVAGEIVEHLANPGAFLRDLHPLMRHGTVLLVTTVNAYCGFRMAQYALRGRGGRAEPVHPEHVAYYSYATLRRLLADSGFDVIDMCFYDIGREHLPYTRRALRWINAVATSVAPQLADGLIAECRLATPAPGRA